MLLEVVKYKFYAGQRTTRSVFQSNRYLRGGEGVESFMMPSLQTSQHFMTLYVVLQVLLTCFRFVTSRYKRRRWRDEIDGRVFFSNSRISSVEKTIGRCTTTGERR